MTLDSASVEGPSPMQALAFALASCMAMDVVHILKKGRHDLQRLKADLNGERAPEDPRRFTSIELNYTITGVVPTRRSSARSSCRATSTARSGIRCARTS